MAGSGQQSKVKGTRSVEEIRRDISVTRTRTAAFIEGLAEDYHPKAIKHRFVEDARTAAQDKYETVRDGLVSQVKDDEGQWRVDRLKLAGAVSAAGAFGILVLRAIVGRLTGATARRKFQKSQAKAAKTASKTAKKAARTAKKTAKKDARKTAKAAKKQARRASK
ncbi:DUF3618 domain-containing protein [Acidipropionibacterium jensenii]|uniref:DUF3618 domain-containing protein n=1 Tax=Acidipropionibacterium jensenii TaxID=1749 RepID=UPI00214C8F4F|nr:DUF3618 domain-containing protein [Acidipropionibacterium jensenii]